MEFKVFTKGQKIVKVWSVLIRCVDTGAVLCLIMESMETKSIVNALLRLQLRMGRIDKVSVDSGTKLIELKRMGEVSNGLLKFKEVVAQQVNSQFRNYCERPVQVGKRVVRMMTGTLKHQKLTVFQKEEAELIIETSCYIINEIPYAADAESLYISPNDMLVPNFKLNSLASTTSPLANVNILIQNLKTYNIEINKVLQ